MSRLLALAVVLAVAADAPATGRKVALLVGVNEYTNRNLEKLEFAERDVSELGKLLTGAGYQVTLLTGPAATGDRVRAALDAAVKGVGKADTVLVGLSGHGVELSGVPYFCPANGEPHDPTKLVSLNAVLKLLDERGGGTNLLLVDACRTPVTAARKGITGSRVDGLSDGTAVFFSCSGRQAAVETAAAGGGHGVFFYCVLEGLRGKAVGADGAITWDGLVGYVKGRMRADAGGWFAGLPADRRQTPHSLGSLPGDVVLVAAAAAVAAKPVAEPPKPTPAGDYWPVRLSGTWVYRTADGPVTVRLSPVADGTQLEFTFRGQVTNTETVAVRADGLYRTHSGGRPLSPVVNFFPLTNGRPTAPVRERVTVPHGTFEAVVVDAAGPTQYPLPMTLRYWLAPGAGIVKVAGTAYGHTVLLELAEVRP